MRRPFLSSLRVRLILLVLIATIPALGLMVYTDQQQRQQAAAAAHEGALRLARVASNEQVQRLDSVRVLLVALTRLPEVRRQDPAACNALFADLGRQYPHYLNLGVIAPNGAVMCNSTPTPPAVNLGDRAYFQRAVQTRAFAIGDYQIDRITGKPSVNAAYPVLDASGQIEAVVFVSTDLAWFNQLAAKAGLPEGATLTVMDREATILARYPDPEQWVGMSVPEAPIAEIILSGQGEGTAEAAGVDGVRRLYAFTSLGNPTEDGEAYVYVGIPAAIAFAEVNRLLTRNLVGLTTIVLFALVAAWIFGDLFVLRKVNALVAATRRLRAGDLSTRSGLPHTNGELSLLAHAFDEMAATLQTRAAEVETSQESLRRYADRLKILHEIDQGILAAQSPEAIADAALRGIWQLIPYRRATVGLYDFGAKEFRVLATHALGSNPVSPGKCLPLESLGDIDQTLEVLRQGSVHRLALQSLSAPSPVIQAVLAEGILELSVVPLIVQGELIGSFSFGEERSLTLTPEHIEIAREVADQLSVAIQQTRFREELRRHAADLERRVAERTAELEKARHVADHANQAKSEFLSRMSHELRTPLNAVLGFAQLLQMDALSEEQRESVEHIDKGGRHLLGLINEVLDIARIEAGRLTISLEPVPVQSLVQESLDLIAPLAAAEQIHLDGHLADTPGLHVQADRQRLKQILLNLLSNAVKYNRKGGAVTLSYDETPTGRLRINVTDTGPGIAPEKMERLFKPFERLDVDQTGIEGSGLGLALSKRLAEAMGGTLGVESSVGRGSTFWVELPLVEDWVKQLDGSEDAPAPVKFDAPQAARVVLYVEDNLSNLKLIERLVAHRSEVRLVPAMQGRLGLDLAREHRPHLVLLDLHLPDMPGEEFLLRLRAMPETREIPVVVISADATPGQTERLLASGARAYLTKPLDVEKFLAILDEALQEREPAQAEMNS